jgi:ribose-phosphate pyrophosphokinase
VKSELRVFAGTSNPVLANMIAEYVGVPLGEIDIKQFPDGETFVKIEENIRGRDVFVVQSICKPPNESLMELLIMIDAMRRASPRRINAVLPFYGYARQDRKDQPRVPITAKLVANLLVAAGANRLLTVDLHAQQIQGFFDIPVDHLHASPIIAKHLKELNLPNPVIVSPDMGAAKAAYAYSQMLGCGLAIAAKKRIDATEVENLTVVGEVAGCTAIMVDDLTTTAGTLCSASDAVKAAGALDVYAAVTHAAITPMGLERLKNSSIKGLVVTDTIPLNEDELSMFPITVLSVADLLGEAIIRIHEDQSVTSLFRMQN